MDAVLLPVASPVTLQYIEIVETYSICSFPWQPVPCWHQAVSKATSFSVLDLAATSFLGHRSMRWGQPRVLCPHSPSAARWQLLPRQKPFITQEVKPKYQLQEAWPCLFPAFLPPTAVLRCLPLRWGLILTLNTFLLRAVLRYSLDYILVGI